MPILWPAGADLPLAGERGALAAGAVVVIAACSPAGAEMTIS
jgi:hypothetical protein